MLGNSGPPSALGDLAPPYVETKEEMKPSPGIAHAVDFPFDLTIYCGVGDLHVCEWHAHFFLVALRRILFFSQGRERAVGAIGVAGGGAGRGPARDREMPYGYIF